MCRSDVAPTARVALAKVLAEIREALAAEMHVDTATIRVGPVDFGPEESA